MSHELGLRFNSPTVNLWFTPKEFIKFLSQLEYYLYDCKIEMDEKNSESDFIYARTLGQGPQQTAAYAREVVQAMAGQGVASVLKHFPGYGNNADTHTGIAHDMRSYETFEQAKQKWIERLERLNMDNLYIIMVQKDGCTEQDICSFDSLKFKHKVIFTVKEYPQYRSAYYIPKSEVDIQNVKNLCDYQSKFTGKRWLDEFDWISFLNER